MSPQVASVLALCSLYIMIADISSLKNIAHLPLLASVLLVILICFDCPVSFDTSNYLSIFCFAALCLLFQRGSIYFINPKGGCPYYVITGLSCCHIASLVYILDWNVDWQEWPIPSFLGLNGGILCGYVLECVMNITVWRGATRN
jgi:hypothetical protein